CLEPLGEHGDVVFDRGETDHPPGESVAPSNSRRIEGDVLAQRAREQRGVLREVTDESATLICRQVRERHAVEEPGPGRDRVHTEDRPRERALPRSDRPGDGDQRACPDVEGQFVERRPVGTRILERDISKGQGRRPLATRLRLLYTFGAARNVTGLERRESRFASYGPRGREQRANPLVRSRSALQRV